MRDHPAVPNVFRVASSHSINSMGVAATPSSNNMQQQLKMGANMKYVKSNSYEQQKAVQLEPQPQQQLAKHQLTTSASVEQTHQSMQQQQSPYATLPRGGLRRTQQQQQQQQYFKQQQLTQQVSQKHLQTGVINTISGSIPATGFQSLAGSFSDLQLNNLSRNNNICSTSSTNNNDKRQQQLLLHHKQQQQQQHRPHQQRPVSCKPVEQQWASLSSEDANAALEAQPGFTNVASARGSYLWLLTPVAAR